MTCLVGRVLMREWYDKAGRVAADDQVAIAENTITPEKRTAILLAVFQESEEVERARLEYIRHRRDCKNCRKEN